MAANLHRPNSTNAWNTCVKCRVAVTKEEGWCLSWAYGNNRMIFLYYCCTNHLPKNHREEARRRASR